MAACSRTLTAGACRWASPTVGACLGTIARAAITASCSGVTVISSSGSSAARCGSRDAVRGCIRPAVAIRSAKVCAMSLNARYCSRRAKSMSRASMRARSSSSSGPDCGSSRAALRSSRVAATSRNSVAWLEVPAVGLGLLDLDVRDELVGDPGDGDLGDVELVLADQAEQQVERPGEVVEGDLEGRGRGAPGEHPAGGDVGVLGGSAACRPRPRRGPWSSVRPPHRGR